MGLALVGLGVVAWATIGASSRLVRADTATMIFWRSLFGGLATLAMLLATNGRASGRVIGRLRGPGVAVVTMSATGTVLFQVAVRLGAVADVAVVYATLPIIAAVLGWVVLRQTTSPATLLASLLAVAGVALTASAGGTDGRMAGATVALATTVCYASVIVLLSRHSALPVLPVVSAASFCVALAVLPWADPLGTARSDVALLAGFGILQIAFADSVFSRGSQLAAPPRTALISTLEGPLSTSFAWLIVHEAPSTAAITGGALVMAAVLGSLLWEARAAARTPDR